MKRIVVLLLCILGMAPGHAQNTEYLLGSEGWKIGGFGGPLLQLASVNDQLAFYNGGGGGAIVNGKFFIGGYGMGLSGNHNINPARLANSNSENTYQLDFGHGGLWLGYNFKPAKMFHFTLSSTLGGGNFSIEAYNDDGFQAEYVSGNTLVLTPAAGVEINVIPWMRIAATAGFQYVAGSGSSTWPTDLSSPVMQLQLKFGYFATD